MRKNHGLREMACLFAVGLASVLSAAAAPASANGSPDGIELQVWERIQAQIESDRYRVQQSAGTGHAVSAVNPQQQLAMRFDGEKVQIVPRADAVGSWRFEIRLVSWGSEKGTELVFPAAVFTGETQVEYRRGTLTEWYMNRPDGLEQGFEIASPPSVAGDEVVLDLAVTGGLQPQLAEGGQSVLLRSPGGSAVLSYRNLSAWDTEGRKLAARMELIEASGIRLSVSVSRARYPITIDPVITQVMKLLPVADDSSEGEYGSAVALRGNTMMVGSPEDDASGSGSGAVWVFSRDQGGAGNWGLVKRITAPDGASGDRFGSSISTIDDYAVIVGAPGDDDNGADSGSAYIFYKDEGGTDNWGQVVKLTATDGASGDGFGSSVSLGGFDYAIVGAPKDDDNGTDSGSVYFFTPDETDTWRHAKFTASDGVAGDWFGWSVSINGGFAIVGTPLANDNGANSGSAYFFARDEGGSWGQEYKVTASDGAALDAFGYSVSISGTNAIVGAYGDDDNGSSSGSAYLFSLAGNNTWVEAPGKLSAFDAAAGDWFGYSVSISGDIAVVGAHQDDDDGTSSGSAHVFRRIPSSPDWTQVAKITAADGASGDELGNAVAISGYDAVVGAHRDDDVGFDSGSAYVFFQDQGGADNWGQVAKRVPQLSSSARGDSFGYSVSISSSGDDIIVGAHGDNDSGLDSGSASLFSRDQGGTDNWGLVAKLTASDGESTDEFGVSVSISGDTAIVGAHHDDTVNGNSCGSAYLFSRDQGGTDNWGQVTKLTAADGTGGEDFGISVSISGDTAIVGAYYDDTVNGSACGSAYIFSRDQGGVGNWGQVTKLIAADGENGDEFGVSVSISGDVAIVGAYLDDDLGPSSGSAYLFSRNQGGTDNWGQVAKLTASDGTGSEEFGISVSLCGDTAIVGAHNDDTVNGTWTGSAYLFSRDQGGADNWGQVTKLTAADGESGDEFGFSVSISGNTAFVGAYCEDDNGTDSGSAYHFSRDQGGADNWGQVTKLTASDLADYDNFGTAVSIGGGTAIVGADGDDDVGLSSGSAYLFTVADPPGPVSDLTSPSHPLDTPTADATVDMTWTAATGGNDIAGYGCHFSTAASWTCDEVQDTTGTSTTSPSLADGSWYFHVCAVDIAGDWGPVASAGPHVVDNTPPGPVSNLASPSHPVGTPTPDGTIDMTWTAATDSNGVAGYAYEFSGAASWDCDQVQDTVGSGTSAPCSGGNWYFHICAVDAAGNWGPVASAGPYVVADEIFADGFESGNTSAWSAAVP